MANYRCQISIIDTTTKKTRKCKNRYKFDILEKKCCTIHANSLYKNFIIKIQRAFKAYKLRKKINYFKLLPTDLWHKILTDNFFYENKRNKKIAEIILNKIDIFIKKYFNNPEQMFYLFGAIEFYSFQQDNNHPIELYVPAYQTHPDANYLINHVLYLFYLLDKYQLIIIEEKKFFDRNYKIAHDYSSMYLKFLSLREKLLSYIYNIDDIENYKYIECVYKFKTLYNLCRCSICVQNIVTPY